MNEEKTINYFIHTDDASCSTSRMAYCRVQRLHANQFGRQYKEVYIKR